jgi:hypothetical protein
MRGVNELMGTVPYCTVPYRTVPYRYETVPYRTGMIPRVSDLDGVCSQVGTILRSQVRAKATVFVIAAKEGPARSGARIVISRYLTLAISHDNLRKGVKT